MDNKKFEFDNFIKFMKAANNVCKERGKTYEFECPICKGKAQAGKANCNGHLHANCSKCGMQIMQ